MNYPAGLKLNSELVTFIASLYDYTLIFWKGVYFLILDNFIKRIVFLMPNIILFIASSGKFGATFILSLTKDLMAVCTLHLKFLYYCSARFYRYVILIIWSTFHLFRGKKWNPLRHRIDSAEYTLEQLLVGAIIFTILVFLFPTVAVYYILFFLVYKL
jgi:phosphatidylinositol glycan class Q protein